MRPVEANMIDSSSKIDVHRLNMVDLLIPILLLCALLGLVCLVLSVSRDQCPCITGTVST